jgi:hypothetical protein
VPQVQSAALEALKDLGYTRIRCEPEPDAVIIRARTFDGRPARITIRPRNAMAAMIVKIGPVGDEMVSQALVQRVALNFGQLPRTIIPLEPTLARRIDPLTPRRLIVPPGEVLPASPAESISPSAPDSPGPFAPEDAEPEGDPIPRSTNASRRRLLRLG